jgi:hypothetical protein
MGMKQICFWTFLYCALTLSAFTDVVINELDYDPDDTRTSRREFIELYNPDEQTVNLSGYQFIDGIRYTFPANTTLAPNTYLLVVRDPNHSAWRNHPAKILGPFEGKLSNEGETITLIRPDASIVETFSYKVSPPWPAGANGYGYTLERISWTLPASDFHSWRTSLTLRGTPGRQNSVHGTLPYPMILQQEISPRHPTSDDPVRVSLAVDYPDEIESAWLRFETVPQESITRELVRTDQNWRYWKGTSAPSPNRQWTQLDFDDSDWQFGRGGFGYGDTQHVNTRLNDMRYNYSTFYIRRYFNVNDPSELGNLTLRIYHDDGFICYINGREAARSNAPFNYTHESLANENHESDILEEYSIGAASDYLQTGENVIALVGFNVWKNDSTDFVLAPTLVASSASDEKRMAMNFASRSSSMAILDATIPPQTSQTLVRYNLEINLKSGFTQILPHVTEPHPFYSYFVYDDEIPSSLPILWIFESQQTALPEISGQYHAMIALMPGEKPQVFDGVRYVRSENGNKIRFLKGEEFRGDRTINIIPEAPPFGGTAGETGPAREYLGFWFYNQMGILAPRAEWFRVIEDPGTRFERHTQRLIVQQVNERFLQMNGYDPEGDLYKLEHDKGYIKHTNLDEDQPNQSITNLRTPLMSASSNNQINTIRQIVQEQMDVDQVLTYTVTSVLTSNWDGFFNNHWMYLRPGDGKWIIIPWDLDKLWGFTDTQFMFYEMPIDFPRYGNAEHASRRPGDITGPFFKVPELYEEYKLRLRVQLDKQYAPDAPIWEKIDQGENLLLQDLNHLEQYTDTRRIVRRQQIQFSFQTLRQFIQLRQGFLDPILPPQPTSVSDWHIY